MATQMKETCIKKNWVIKMTCIALLLMGLRCSQSEKIPDSTLSLDNCSQVHESFRSPTTFEGVVTLINKLPKPVSVNCFLYNYDHPLNIFAVDNELNAQPSGGPDSPRIFIIMDDFTVSVVPAGSGKDNIEFSKIVTEEKSIKGDLHFPIQQPIEYDDIFSGIVNETNDGTVCRLCHGQESQHLGLSYSSNIIAPDENLRITKEDLRDEIRKCRTETTSRCTMINYIYSAGEVDDVTWPF
jgi:hypothetical protein